MGARTELILPSHDAVTSMRQHAPSSVLCFQRRARASVRRLPYSSEHALIGPLGPPDASMSRSNTAGWTSARRVSAVSRAGATNEYDRHAHLVGSAAIHARLDVRSSSEEEAPLKRRTYARE